MNCEDPVAEAKEEIKELRLILQKLPAEGKFVAKQREMHNARITELMHLITNHKSPQAQLDIWVKNLEERKSSAAKAKEAAAAAAEAASRADEAMRLAEAKVLELSLRVDAEMEKEKGKQDVHLQDVVEDPDRLQQSFGELPQESKLKFIHGVLHLLGSCPELKQAFNQDAAAGIYNSLGQQIALSEQKKMAQDTRIFASDAPVSREIGQSTLGFPVAKAGNSTYVNSKGEILE